MSLFEQAYAVLSEAMTFYRSHGCPCAYPRFAQLAGFDFRAFDAGPVGSHLQQILIGLATADDGPYKPKGEWAGNGKPFICPVCGTEAVLIDEEFSINMRFLRLELGKIKARPRGMPAGIVPAPEGGGMFGFSSEDIEKCRRGFLKEGTFEELGKYLMGVDLTWPPRA